MSDTLTMLMLGGFSVLTISAGVMLLVFGNPNGLLTIMCGVAALVAGVMIIISDKDLAIQKAEGKP